MKRKVQQLGKSGSYILTLPKDWCKKYGIKNGSELEISTDQLIPASLLISHPQNHISEKKKGVIISSDHRNVGRAILGRYLDGFEIIKITNISDTKKLEVRKLIKKLISKLYVSRETEIINEAIEIHVSNEIISPLTVIEDLFIKAKNMMSDALESYIYGNTELAKDVISRDDDADKLYFYIVRTLKKILDNPVIAKEVLQYDQETSFDIIDSLDLRMIASYLEKLADEAENLALKVTDIGVDEQYINKIQNICNRAIQKLESSFLSYKMHQPIKAMDIIFAAKDIRTDLNKLKLKSKDYTLIQTLFETIDCIVDIADLVGQQSQDLDLM